MSRTPPYALGENTKRGENALGENTKRGEKTPSAAGNYWKLMTACHLPSYKNK